MGYSTRISPPSFSPDFGIKCGAAHVGSLQTLHGSTDEEQYASQSNDRPQHDSQWAPPQTRHPRHEGRCLACPTCLVLVIDLRPPLGHEAQQPPYSQGDTKEMQTVERKQAAQAIAHGKRPPWLNVGVHDAIEKDVRPGSQESAQYSRWHVDRWHHTQPARLRRTQP